MERIDYEGQAQEFLARFNLTVKAAFKGDKCPPWEDKDCMHGDRYRVTVKRSLGKAGGRNLSTSISFDFWNSVNDMQAGKSPTAYNILACISSDASMSTDPDEVVEELGEMRPSQAVTVAKFATRLQAFFTKEEIEALAEIN